MSLRKVLFALALTGGLLLPAAVQAAVNYTVTALNMRTGPGTGYARITVIPAGGAVQVYSCTRSWCKVNWRGRVGWASARYLSGSYAPRRYYRTPAPYYYGGYPYSGFSFFFGSSPRYYGYRKHRPRYYSRHSYGGRYYSPRVHVPRSGYSGPNPYYSWGGIVPSYRGYGTNRLPPAAYGW